MENYQAKKKVSTKNIIVAVAAAVAAVALILLITQVLIPRNEYLLAEDLVTAGQHGKAVAAFRELGDYGDSEARADALMEANPALTFALAQPGDTVTYGTYEQDNDTSNGPEPIEWIVLVQEEERVLAVSRDILDAKQYHLYENQVLPQLSALTKWLNLEFAAVAFDGNLRRTVETAGLLKQEYVATLESMKVNGEVTAYAQANGAAGENWWLYENQSYEGSLTALTAGSSETATITEVRGVRPAIWVLTNNDLLSGNEQAVAEELQARENAYEQAMKLKTIFELESAANLFATLGTYADAQAQYLQCIKEVAQRGVSPQDLLTAMEKSIADAYSLSVEVKDGSMQTKELQYICSVYNPFCGSFNFEVNGTVYTVQSDFLYSSIDQCVYWVCRQEEGGLFTTEVDGEPTSFFETNSVVYDMTTTRQIGAEEVKISFQDGQLVAQWGEYQTVETDENGKVTSREGYRELRTVTGTKK